MHERVDAILAAFEVRQRGTATPPADDVREALIVTIAQRDRVADHIWDQMVGVARSTVREVMADAFVVAGITVTAEVRPRGTVTDAAALAKAWDEGFTLATRNSPNQPHPLAQSNPYRGEVRS